ncbi:hypothetical protein EIP86_009926 [Pleurotus ostreatoroseus]|nr:hypothetical protein EIP86_009926 [Pleurotus ostreatoroseus]
MDQYVRDPRLIKRLRIPDTPESHSGDESPVDLVAQTRFPTAGLPSRPSPTGTRPTAAPGPFNHNTNSDLILRSSDLVDFYVRSPVFTEASPTLQDMFSAVVNSSPTKRRRLEHATISAPSIPTLCLSEHSCILECLLRLTYGIGAKPILDPFELCDALGSAKKYELTRATNHLLVQFSALANTETARLYMLACRRGWEDCMRIAARASLTTHLSAEHFATYEDIDKGLFVTAPEHARLMAYHRRCAFAASNVICNVSSTCAKRSKYLSLRWLTNDNWVWFRCEHQQEPTDKVQLKDGTLRDVALWWTAFLRKAQDRLKERPDGSTILDVKLWGFYAVSGIEHCSTCKRQVLEDLCTFKDILAQEVNKAIETIGLECPKKPTVATKSERSTPPLS